MKKKESNDNLPSNKLSFKQLVTFLYNLGPEIKWALFFIFILGYGLLWLAIVIKSQTIHEIGVLCVTITPILFVYEIALRKHLQKEMAKEIIDVLKKTGLQKKIIAILTKSMPDSYRNILKHGITDAYTDLDSKHLKDRLTSAKNCLIRINQIWMPFLNESIDQDVIINSIERGCTYQIVLCDPSLDEPLEKRAKSTSYSIDYYKSHIYENIIFLNELWVVLKQRNLQNSLEVKLHKDFIGISLIGIADYFIFGLYLQGKVATSGMQIKIDQITHETDTEFYTQIENHFNKQWQIAHKTVCFSENGAIY